jgi:regulator of sirC expression with transglutaminase-like and TPR domain
MESNDPSVTTAYLALLAQAVNQPDADLDLARAALLIAEPEYPGLDLSVYTAVLDKLGNEVRRRVGGDQDKAARRISRLLYDEVGFQGDLANYYDPRNNYLNQVIERRAGIPVTLAVVFLEVARRAGVQAQGVAFPGHFLVQIPTHGAVILVDPFFGRQLEQIGRAHV